MCANYMLFDDVVRETSYDLWVGDEAWEVDHFLHENPERKIAPYAFLTDVVGFLPVDPSGDPREAELCADYNAEMVEHRERFPYVRDRSVFIGGFDELPEASLGVGLPTVREFTERRFSSVPYVVPFDPAAYRRPARLRRELGYGTGYPLYLAAVGGTAVGRELLELTAEAFELVRQEEPDARMVMVTGPRLDPALLPDVEGMEKRGYVDSLFAHLPAPIWRSSRAGCRRRWSSRRRDGRSSTSRWPTTGSSSTSSPTASTTTAPVCGWTSLRPHRPSWRRR
jgi:hypothetical protein